MPPTKDRRRIRFSRFLWIFVCILGVSLSLLLLRMQPPKASQSVQVITSDWEPYVDSTAEDGGVIGQLVLTVLESSGFHAQLSYDTWDSGLNKVARGDAFAIFPMVKSSERLEKFEYSDPLVGIRYVLFQRAGELIPEEALQGDLSNVKVGLIEGYDYWPELDASGAQFERFSSTSEGFYALERGDVDLLAESDVVGKATLLTASFTSDAGHFEIVEGDNPALASEDYVHFVMRKGKYTDVVMRDFNASLEAFKQTQQYDEVIAKLRGLPDSAVFRSDSLVEVVDKEGELLGAVPSGVSVRILEWPEDLRSGSLVSVKMKNGPLAGRTGYVAVDELEVQDAKS